MGTKLAIASIPYEGNVLKALRIHIAAHLSFFLRLSSNKTLAHIYRTRVEIHKEQ